MRFFSSLNCVPVCTPVYTLLVMWLDGARLLYPHPIHSPTECTIQLNIYFYMCLTHTSCPFPSSDKQIMVDAGRIYCATNPLSQQFICKEQACKNPRLIQTTYYRYNLCFRPVCKITLSLLHFSIKVCDFQTLMPPT